MKHGILLILIALCAVQCGCRSSSSSTTAVSSGTEKVFKAAVRHAADSSRTTRDDSVFTVAVDTTRTYSIRVELDTAGRVRSIQEEWRDIGRTIISTGTGRSSSVSVGSSGSSVSENKQSDSKSETNQTVSSDSRPVQGHEWIYVLLVVGLLIIIPIILIRKKWKLPS